MCRCRAVVGYIGRRQKLTLGNGCIWVARVLHELLHVLGFFHEHTRPDRDEFVTIHEDNVKKGTQGVYIFVLLFFDSSAVYYHMLHLTSASTNSTAVLFINIKKGDHLYHCFIAVVTQVQYIIICYI